MSEKAGAQEPSHQRKSNSEGGIPQDEYSRIPPPPSALNNNNLPPYSGPTTPSTRSTTTLTTPSYPLGLPRLNYSLYCLPTFKLSGDETTIKSYKPEYSTSPATLVSLIHSQATIPPKVQIRIRGGGSVAPGGEINPYDVDFDIRINMMGVLVGDGTSAARWNYLKLVEEGEMAARGGIVESVTPNVAGGLEDWVRKYCADRSAIKEFTLRRTVTNWDTEYLEGRLHAMIASIDYRRRVDITFPTTHSTVTVHSPDKVNRFFTTVEGLFTGTKRYAIVTAVWPYASGPARAEGRRCAVQSEQAWWEDWKDAIRHAMLQKRKGWVTSEDRIEFLMCPEKDKGKKWE